MDRLFTMSVFSRRRPSELGLRVPYPSTSELLRLGDPVRTIVKRLPIHRVIAVADRNTPSADKLEEMQAITLPGGGESNGVKRRDLQGGQAGNRMPETANIFQPLSVLQKA